MNVTGCSSLCVKDDNPDIFMGFELCLVVECSVCCCCCNTYLLAVTLHDTAEMVRADHILCILYVERKLNLRRHDEKKVSWC